MRERAEAMPGFLIPGEPGSVFVGQRTQPSHVHIVFEVGDLDA